MKPACLLVVGATGTTGRELLRQLSSAGLSCRALVRDVKASADLASSLVDLVEGDLSNNDSLEAALNGIRKVYFSAPVHPDALAWFESLLSIAATQGVEHIVRLSALTASGQSPVMLLKHHGLADEALVQSGLGFTVLRPNVFFQNMLWQAQNIATSGMFYLPYGDARQSLVDTRDIAAAALFALTDRRHENKIYNLTGPEALNYFDIARQLSEACGKPVSYVPVSRESSETAMREAGMPDWHAGAIGELQSHFAIGHHGQVTPDLESVLKRPPNTFEQFARDYCAAF